MIKGERFFWLGIIATLVIILCIKTCKKPDQPTQIVTTDTVWSVVIDSVPYKVPIPGSKLPAVRDTVIITKDGKPYPVPVQVDTAAILEDYYSAYTYSDTNLIGAGRVVINDTVSRNKIKGRSLEYFFKQPTVNKTVTIKPKTALYGGVEVGGSKKDPFYMGGVNLMLNVPNKNTTYEMGALLTRDKQIIYKVGRKWKLL